MSSCDDQMRLGEPSGAIWYTSEPGVVGKGGIAATLMLNPAAPADVMAGAPGAMAPCPEGVAGVGCGCGMFIGGGGKARVFSPTPEA